MWTCVCFQFLLNEAVLHKLNNNLIATGMCLSNPTQTTTKVPPAVILHLAKLSSASTAVTFLFGRKILLSSLQQPATSYVCVCNKPKIFPVLLTSSSTKFCPCDAFAQCVQILFCQRNFCLLRHCRLLLPYCSPTATASQPAPVCPLISSFYDSQCRFQLFSDIIWCFANCFHRKPPVMCQIFSILVHCFLCFNTKHFCFFLHTLSSIQAQTSHYHLSSWFTYCQMKSLAEINSTRCVM